MKRRKGTAREALIGVIGLLVISCVYGSYLYLFEDIALGEIVKEIVINIGALVGVSIIGIIFYYLLGTAEK